MIMDTIQVLIDTWWNVNQDFVDSLLKIAAFNGYMLECEYLNPSVIRGRTVSFNRYMVECEFNLPPFQNLHYNCFNRYMVECECL